MVRPTIVKLVCRPEIIVNRTIVKARINTAESPDKGPHAGSETAPRPRGRAILVRIEDLSPLNVSYLTIKPDRVVGVNSWWWTVLVVCWVDWGRLTSQTLTTTAYNRELYRLGTTW